LILLTEKKENSTHKESIKEIIASEKVKKIKEIIGF